MMGKPDILIRSANILHVLGSVTVSFDKATFTHTYTHTYTQTNKLVRLIEKSSIECEMNI